LLEPLSAARVKRISHHTHPMNQSQVAATNEQTVIQAPKILADDERGKIEQIDAGGAMSILRITSKKGSVRANHYHQQDYHFCYLESGKIRYVEREGGDESAPLKEWMIEPGQVFYTKPMIAHAMEFVEDSVFYPYTPRSGDSKEYENDVIRVELINPDEAATRAAG